MKRVPLLTLLIGLAVCSLIPLCVSAQQEIKLYPSKEDNPLPSLNTEEVRVATGNDIIISNVSEPTLTVYLPPKEKATGVAVIICPGGGYQVLCYKREGVDIAENLNKQGIAAIILKYRLPDEQFGQNKHLISLADVRQAVKTVREQAPEWGINVNKIGLMGFSAGGHLVSTAGTHFDSAISHPDFMILVYPVISFADSITHSGTKHSLLGNNPSKDYVTLFSNELHVSHTTPPTLLIHSVADDAVPVENSLLFFEQLRKNNIQAEMHLYAKGEHGFLTYPSFNEWFGRCVNWINSSFQEQATD